MSDIGGKKRKNVEGEVEGGDSTVMTPKPTLSEGAEGDNGERIVTSVVREQDRLLPIANVSRIMKKALPANAKVAKDAREAMQECVSEFISFVTSEASDKCLQEKRKTINGDDILWAMSALGFDKYIEPLKIYLQKYKESIRGEKMFAAKARKKQKTADTEATKETSPTGAAASTAGS